MNLAAYNMLSYLKHKKTPILLGLLTLALFLWVEVSQGFLYRAVDRLESMVYDAKLRHLNPFEKADNQSKVVIIAIDEASLQAYGQWPWSRLVLVDLIEKLKSYEVTLIGLDLVFSEPTLAEHDQLLAQKIAETESVLGYILHNQSQLTSRTPVKYIRPLEQTLLDKSTIPQLSGITTNLQPIHEAAKSSGFLSTFRDPDGSLRRVPLVLRFENKMYTAFSFEMARQFLLVDSPKLILGQLGKQKVLEAIRLDAMTIPVTTNGEFLVPYRQQSFPQVSAKEVLQQQVQKEQLQNAVVVVGLTALGISDLMVTPINRVMPGVQVHTNILNSMLNQHFIYQPSWLKGGYVILMVILGTLLALVLPYLGAVTLVMVSLTILMALVGLGLWSWCQWHTNMHTLNAIFMVFSQSLITVVYGFYEQSKHRHSIKRLFGRYVDPEHINEMVITEDEDYGLAGESREMTILFADIRNFTQYAETLGAEKVKALLNEYFTPMTRIIFEQGGTIDKYVGDMLIAFWGAPLPHSNHSDAAIETAFKMQAELTSINLSLHEKGFPKLGIGIGINTGMVTVGDMGSEYRRSYTVLGDNVNLAAFFERLTKHYQVPLVVGENTVLSSPHYAYRFLEKVKLKGREHLVAAYEPLGLVSDTSQSDLSELDAYERALAFYFERVWDAAEVAFADLVMQHPHEAIYHRYLQNTRTHKAKGVAERWDGSVRINL